MTLQKAEIINLTRRKLHGLTADTTESITTYNVSNKSVQLIISKSHDNRLMYKIVMTDNNTGDNAETDILFAVYQSMYIHHSRVTGTNNAIVFTRNSGIRKNVHEICKAIAHIHNMCVGKQPY